MIHKTITIGGKQVEAGYCFASEIGFNHATGDDFYTFIIDSSDKIKANAYPDTVKGAKAILACVKPYYKSKEEDTPITLDDITHEASPAEFLSALATIFNMRLQFYGIGTDPTPEQPTEEKNA